MFLVSVQAAAALQQQKPRPFGRCRSSVLPHCKRKTSTRCVLVDGAREGTRRVVNQRIIARFQAFLTIILPAEVKVKLCRSRKRPVKNQPLNSPKFLQKIYLFCISANKPPRRYFFLQLPVCLFNSSYFRSQPPVFVQVCPVFRWRCLVRLSTLGT